MRDDYEFKRHVAGAIRLARDSALRGAIDLCAMFARDGGSAEQCVRALTDLRDMLPKPPGTMS